MSMKASVKKTGETTTVTFDGTLDYETPEHLSENLEKIIQKSDSKNIIFDMKDLSLVGSQGIGSFVNIMKEFNKRDDVAPKYCNVKSEWKKILAAFAGDDESFDIYDTEEKALKSLGKLDN